MALDYGFRKPVLADELIAWDPTIWPFHDKVDIKARHFANIEDYSRVNFKAVIVLHDSWNWGRDIQLICDVLRSNKGHIGTLSPVGSGQRQSVPLYFSNPDFQWATGFPISRMAQGAFRLSLNSLYRQLTGHDITITEQFGKPFPSTYE